MQCDAGQSEVFESQVIFFKTCWRLSIYVVIILVNFLFHNVISLPHHLLMLVLLLCFRLSSRLSNRTEKLNVEGHWRPLAVEGIVEKCSIYRAHREQVHHQGIIQTYCLRMNGRRSATSSIIN